MQTGLAPSFAALLRSIIGLSLYSSLVLFNQALAQAPDELLAQTLAEQAQIDVGSQRSQIMVAQLDDQTSEYFGEYQVALQQLERLRIYNGNLRNLVEDQQREVVSINSQLNDFGDVEKGIVPLMYDLITALEQFIDLDMPFSQVERRTRVDRLRSNMERSDLTVSEKYRQIMEAYDIETQYGRNIEAYMGSLEIDGVDRKVDLLRVGRILLAYQTPDLTQTGYWDKAAKSWQPLEGKHRRAITEGLRIARKQAAPALITIPLQAAGASR